MSDGRRWRGGSGAREEGEAWVEREMRGILMVGREIWERSGMCRMMGGDGGKMVMVVKMVDAGDGGL